MVKITDAFETEGFVEQRKELEALLMSNPEMEKKVQGLIRKVLAEVRKRMGDAASSTMNSDPRKAYKAVRSVIYKRILGGNVNILNNKRASGGGSYTPTRTLKSGQRGGNRKARSERTMKLESYYGSDRGFILRFLNAGTNNRVVDFIPHEKRKPSKWNKHPNTGFRGRIAPRNFFGNRSHQEMENAAENLTQLIDQLIAEK
jgi:hypothetical protein